MHSCSSTPRREHWSWPPCSNFTGLRYQKGRIAKETLSEPVAAPDPKGLAALGPGELFVRQEEIIVGKRRHKNDTKTFEELSYAEQAKSISAQLVVLQRSIRAHTRRSEEENRNSEETMLKCIGQVARMLSRLTG